MYRIAVVEDQAGDAELLRSALGRYGEEKQLEFSLKVWGNAEVFLEQYRHQYDIIFMDIRLPGMDGMEAARRLREVDRSVLLIFLTSLAQYALEGYEVEAIDYVIKPITYQAVRLKLPRVLRRCETEEKEVVIASEGSSFKLPAGDVYYIEIFDHHIQYMTKGGVLRAYGTLKEIEAALPGGFFRVNNQTIVNLRRVTSIRSDNVVAENREFALSRRRRKEFMEALQRSGIRA